MMSDLAIGSETLNCKGIISIANQAAAHLNGHQVGDTQGCVVAEGVTWIARHG